MALVCSSCLALAHTGGQVRSGKNDNAVAAAGLVPSACNTFLSRLAGSDGQYPSNLSLVWPKTIRAHSRDVWALKRSRELPHCRRHWRATLGDSTNNPVGMNYEKVGSGAIGTMAPSRQENFDTNVEDDTEGETPATAAPSSETDDAKDTPTKGPANSSIENIASISDGREETIVLASTTREISELSAAPPSGRDGNLQHEFLKQDKEFFAAGKEPYISLVWEAGSEIEVLTPEMASVQDGKDVKDQNFSMTVKEEQHREEESLLSVKISQQVSAMEAECFNRRQATQRTIWISREDNAFDKFFQNMTQIQQKIWLMIVVHGKLAWIRLQQHLARRLRGLEEILSNFPESEDDLDAREAELLAFSDKLMSQSAMTEEAYARSQEALRTTEKMVFQLNNQVGQLKEDVAARDALLRLLRREASVSSESLQRAAQSLSDAERRIIDLERRVQTGEESLHEERGKVSAAVRSAGSLEQATRVAENKVIELTTEISSLKALVASGRRAAHLSAQVNALEQELKSRDSLLMQIKTETIRSTEALKVAAQMKQDLNAARQREVQLTQALESANGLVKELQTEILENLRSVRAEQALRQTEKMLRDAKLEVQLLSKGVEERDKSICIMKDEVDNNIGLLRNAARDREELYNIKLQMEDLKAEVGSKDATLKTMREEMALVVNLARQKQSILSGTSSVNHSSLAAAGSPPMVQVPKLKKKSQSQKQTRKQRSSQSSPQCS